MTERSQWDKDVASVIARDDVKLLRKICPKSGEKCDCPKGQCNAVIIDSLSAFSAQTNNMIVEPKLSHEQSHEHDAEQLAFYQQGADALAAQADTLEAHSLKYQACAQVMQLSSGRFAIFGAYRAGGGSSIELLAIGEWAELEPHVRAYKELADTAWARGQERTLPAKTAADYDSLFGEES